MLGNSERSLNRTVVTGLLRNQKIHVTANQNKLCTFTLCVIEGTKDGSKKTFVDCISWNDQGERIASLPAESKVYVTGRLQTYSWTDKASAQETVQVANSLRRCRGSPKPQFPPGCKEHRRTTDQR